MDTRITQPIQASSLFLLFLIFRKHLSEIKKKQIHCYPDGKDAAHELTLKSNLSDRSLTLVDIGWTANVSWCKLKRNRLDWDFKMRTKKMHKKYSYNMPNPILCELKCRKIPTMVYIVSTEILWHIRTKTHVLPCTHQRERDFHIRHFVYLEILKFTLYNRKLVCWQSVYTHA